MGNVCGTQEILLAADIIDYELCFKTDAIRKYSHTAQDKKVICQAEGAALPGKRMGKFLQDNRSSWLQPDV